MKTIAIILAGGSGKRMGLHLPKQFALINNKPVIAYTLEDFQRNVHIDEINVVCLEGWKQKLVDICKQYKITKLKNVVSGGKTSLESIKLGVDSLKSQAKENDIIVIHDGIRPLVDDEVLDDVIQKAKEYGNAVTALPYNEQLFISKDGIKTDTYIPRKELVRVSTPQAYVYINLYEAFVWAQKENKLLEENAYINTLMSDIGTSLYLAKGSERNIKLTTKQDLRLFEFYLKEGKTYE